MRKVLLNISTILVLLLSPLAATGAVYAVDIFSTCSNGAANSANCADCKTKASATDVCKDINAQPADSNPVLGIIKIVIDIITFIIGAAAVIIIIVSALRMITANGDPKAFSEARSGILYALVGIAVAAVAQFIVLFVIDRFA